ncbi:MAG: phosphoribosyl-AMP cyclohydrolase [Desulfohalobiaceae bacterium]|nr:phosphoribosyl-AMP cyclohydrolase [Desulfohalobiaceae bacterium]
MLAPDFEKTGGLVPAVVQDRESGEVLMLAYMDAQAWEKTLESGVAHFYSRSRDKIWQKGESSGNVQQVKAVRLDCDADTVLLQVHQVGGAACHTGYRSCFYREITPEGTRTCSEQIFDPKEVYS